MKAVSLTFRIVQPIPLLVLVVGALKLCMRLHQPLTPNPRCKTFPHLTDLFFSANFCSYSSLLCAVNFKANI